MKRPLRWLLLPLFLAGCDFVPPTIVLPTTIDAPPATGMPGGDARPAPTRPASADGASGEAMIRPLAEAEAARQAMPSGLVLAVIAQESGFDARALSPAGAEGLMQLMPATVDDINRAGAVQVLDPFDAAQNLAGGCWYLNALRKELTSAKVAPGEEWKLALGAYNGGIGRVGRAIDQALAGAPAHPQARWDDIAAAMPAETRAYVPAIMARWQRYGN